MERLTLFICWCLLGVCVFLGGCRLAVTAEKLEASWEIRNPEIKVNPLDVSDND